MNWRGHRFPCQAVKLMMHLYPVFTDFFCFILNSNRWDSSKILNWYSYWIEQLRANIKYKLSSILFKAISTEGSAAGQIFLATSKGV